MSRHPTAPITLCPRAFGRASRLSDVTDRSHHWIGAFSRQIIARLKCFGRIPRTMPFLGAETALSCVGGRRVGISPVLGRAAKTGGISGRGPGRLLGGVFTGLRADLWIR